MIPIVKTTFFKNKIYITAAATLLFFLGCFSCSAQQVNTFNSENIGKHLTYLEDKTATLTLRDVQQNSDTAFKKGTQNILNFGNTTSAWWLKIVYTAEPHLPIYLIIGAPNIEQIAAYTTDSAGKAITFKTGSLAKQSDNVIIGNNFMLSLPESNKQEQKTIYLRLKTNNILLAPIKLTASDNIVTKQNIKVGIEYLYTGLLIGLLLFNLFLFISIKDNTYLYYVLYVFTLSSYVLIYIRGYAFVFGDDFRIIFNKHPHVFLSLSIITSLVFSSKFLHLDKTARKMNRFFYFVGLLGIVLFVTSALGLKQLSSTIAQALTFITAVLVWIAGIIAYRNGHQPAKYFIVAWFFVLLTAVIVTFSLGGIIEQNEFTIQLVPLGTTIELLLLSFALGDRYKVIMQTERTLRDENLVLVNTQNQRLEKSVNERTLQLSKTINELEDSNAVKNKLFSIIAHDLRSPLSSLMGILSLNDMHALTPDELRQLLAENKKTIDSINNTLNNLLYWAQGQMNGMVTQVDSFSLKKLFDELMLLYLPLIKKKEILVELNIEDQGLVTADQNQINLVIRNLIDNAIKFTPIGGKIEFNLRSISQEVFFSIENEIQPGLEIEIENLHGKKIAPSTYGTQNERGVGLGLLLCYEYVKNNGGILQVSTYENKVKFEFGLSGEI